MRDRTSSVPPGEGERDFLPEAGVAVPENPEAPSAEDLLIEERPHWGEFEGTKVTESGEYQEPTEEEKAAIEQRLGRLAEVFQSADFPWQLDGAINISLYDGKFIRNHKDLDVGVFKDDLSRLDTQLEKNGMGIYLTFEKGGKKLTRRLRGEDFATVEPGKTELSICKVGADGRIDRDPGEPFNFVDLHVNERNQEGDVIGGPDGTTLPKEYFEPRQAVSPAGHEINVSHPAVVAFHKLQVGREHDLKDLELLAPHLGERDFASLNGIIAGEADRSESRAREVATEMWESIAPVVDLTEDRQALVKAFWQVPEFRNMTDERRPRVEQFLENLADYVINEGGNSREALVGHVLEMAKPREKFEKQLEVLKTLSSRRQLETGAEQAP